MNDNRSRIPAEPNDLDEYLSERESAFNLKPGTKARIIWNSGSEREKTDYALVYLHGFRASHPEGDPVHRRIAETFNFNLFLSRLDEHGLQSQYPLLNLTEEKLLNSARFALEIGKRIGKRVILMGTSTGGSLALYLAAQAEFEKQISSLILYSPLIRFHGIKEQVLMNAFGRRCLGIFPGKKHLVKTAQTTYAEDRIWNKAYALQGAIALGSFVEHYMHNELFSKVHCPVFVGYYYKNRIEKDIVVSVSAIQKMTTQLGSRTQFVISRNFPGAGNHVICSSLVSKSVEEVTKETTSFLKSLGSQEAREKTS
ncbi:MAG: alpha/beta hydrolase [Balneolaceae bacterium]|jgi:pimeloyl-ACP methyl ester carboxylesterase